MSKGEVKHVKKRSWVEGKKLYFSVDIEGNLRGVRDFNITSEIIRECVIGEYKVFLTRSGTLYICSNFKSYAPTIIR